MKRSVFAAVVLVVLSTTASGEADLSFESNSHSKTNPVFLWGLSGFLATCIPGFVALSLEWTLPEELPETLGYTFGGAAIGAGISLAASLVFTVKPDDLSFGYVTPTFYGSLVGFGVLGAVTMALYPEIAGYLLIIYFLSLFGIISF